MQSNKQNRSTPQLQPPNMSQFNLNISSIMHESGNNADSVNDSYNSYGWENSEAAIANKNPNTVQSSTNAQAYGSENFDNELSLLEELDIDLKAVASKLKSTLIFSRPDPAFVKDPDMTGPLLLGTILGGLLILVF